MSTFAPGPVVLVACFAAVVCVSRTPLGLQPAMLAGRCRRGVRAPGGFSRFAAAIWAATATDLSTSRARRLAHEALGLQAPHAAEYGKAARTSPWRRIRSAVLLLALIVALGVAVAAGIGVIAFLGGFLLEQAIR